MRLKAILRPLRAAIAPVGSLVGTGPRPRRRSLQSKILTRTLLVAVVPLLLVGSIAVGSVIGLSRSADAGIERSRDELSRDVAGRAVTGAANAMARDAERIVVERVEDVLSLADTPIIQFGARRASEEGDELAGIPSMDLENRFSRDRRLAQDTTAEELLRRTTDRQPLLAELFFTDRNGFTASASTPTSDFVQREEQWWIGAWRDGLYIGDVAFDDSTDVFGLPIAARIDDPDSGRGLGVLRATVDVAAVQQAASRIADDTGTEVSVLDPDGLLLAETGSGHADARIMQADLELDDDRRHVFEAARSAEQPDFMLLDDHVAGVAPVEAGDDLLGEQVSSFPGVDASAVDWSAIAEQPNRAAFAPLSPLAEVQDGLSRSTRTLAVITVLALCAALVAALAVSTRLAEGIVRPLRSLRHTAHDIADHRLPALVEQANYAESHADLPVVPMVELETDDEVEDVAEAFNVVSATAVGLATDQARSRRNISRMFTSLGRRNQSLLNRQLEFIDRLERDESDPELLERLFRLDHLATRMRRNAESLLVLAGEEQPRRWTEPVALADIVRGAVAEVEDYRRVNVDSVDDAMVVGTVASDITHLLAELIENATNFSSPDSPVMVIGRRVVEGYALAVVDDGVGMSRQELEDANRRIESSPRLDRVPSSYLGLYVVGRLAARHGLRVRLVESTSEGIVAKVVLPEAIVDPLPRPTQPSDHPAQDDSAPLTFAGLAEFGQAVTPVVDVPVAATPPSAPADAAAASSTDDAPVAASTVPDLSAAQAPQGGALARWAGRPAATGAIGHTGEPPVAAPGASSSGDGPVDDGGLRMGPSVAADADSRSVHRLDIDARRRRYGNGAGAQASEPADRDSGPGHGAPPAHEQIDLGGSHDWEHEWPTDQQLGAHHEWATSELWRDDDQDGPPAATGATPATGGDGTPDEQAPDSDAEHADAEADAPLQVPRRRAGTTGPRDAPQVSGSDPANLRLEDTDDIDGSPGRGGADPGGDSRTEAVDAPQREVPADGAGGAVDRPRAADATGSDVEDSARAARERLARFQRGVRRGRAQTGVVRRGERDGDDRPDA
jgi:signal transduction histidine kinase